MAVEYEKPTKEQFEAYVEVQKSGVTNMWDVGYVIRLARMQSNVKLTNNICYYIMKNYNDLKKEYGL